MGRTRKDQTDSETAEADNVENKRPTKWERTMKVKNPKAKPVATDAKMTQVCVTLDVRACEDLTNISEIYERKTGAVHSRSAIIRAALKNEYERIK